MLRWFTATSAGAVTVYGLITWACSPVKEEASIESPDLAALETLGYVGEALDTPDTATVGILRHMPARARGGLDYVTVSDLCASFIVRPTGEVLRTWRTVDCRKWDQSILTPDGHVYLIHKQPNKLASRLMKLDWEGTLVWEQELVTHHDVGLRADGAVTVLTMRPRIIPQIDETIPVKDHGIAIFSADGRFLEGASLTDIVLNSPDVFVPRIPKKSREGTIPLHHSNSLDWMYREDLAAKHPFYHQDNVLVTLRTQNVMLMINWPSKRVIWAWGQDDIVHPHDGHVTDSGSVLVFDNGRRKRGSRVVEIDPLTKEIIWEYSGHSFYSDTRSSAQRLPNGNTLVGVADRGMAFEVTPDHDIVWEFRNPVRGPKDKPMAIVRIRNYPEVESLMPPWPID